MRKLGCIILAAGRSLRFGSNKLLTPLAGKPMLAYVLEMLPRERFARITAVVSSPETEAMCRDDGVDTIFYEGGPQSESIRRGIAAMDGMDGCLFVMGDQPLCRRESVERMLDEFLVEPRSVYRLAYKDQQASPVLFPGETFRALSQLTGERGGMSVAKTHPGGIRLVEAEEEAELWDADTPQVLASLETYLTRKKSK